MRGSMSRMLAIGALLLVAACGGGNDTTGNTTPVATVSIGPLTATVGVGDTLRFQAITRSATGTVLTGRSIVWTTTDSAILTISASGLARGSASGTAAIIATSEGVADTVFPNVRVLFASVSVGEGYSCATTTGGSVYCWGSNNRGQRGTGVPGDTALPALVPLSGRMVQVSASTSGGGTVVHTCARDDANGEKCWGYGLYGELGTGLFSSSQLPVAVSAQLPNASFVASGSLHSCAIATTGAAYCWGINSYGQLGKGDTVRAAVPSAVLGGLTFSTLSTGNYQSCGIAADQHAYCWGGNPAQEYVPDTTGASLTPRLVSGTIAFSKLTSGIYHSCGLTTTGAAYCWGGNSDGQLGSGDTVTVVAPVPVAGGHTFVAIDAGAYYTCAVDTTGAGYCWGYYGGNSVLAPQLIPSTDSFVAISGGYDHTCALTAGGDIDCWGNNFHGQLGVGPVVASSTPLRVVVPQVP